MHRKILFLSSSCYHLCKYVAPVLRIFLLIQFQINATVNEPSSLTNRLPLNIFPSQPNEPLSEQAMYDFANYFRKNTEYFDWEDYDSEESNGVENNHQQHVQLISPLTSTPITVNSITSTTATVTTITTTTTSIITMAIPRATTTTKVNQKDRKVTAIFLHSIDRRKPTIKSSSANDKSRVLSSSSRIAPIFYLFICFSSIHSINLFM